MAMAINKVIVIGNLGANPVVRTLPNSGQNVANFSLATTERSRTATALSRSARTGIGSSLSDGWRIRASAS